MKTTFGMPMGKPVPAKTASAPPKKTPTPSSKKKPKGHTAGKPDPKLVAAMKASLK